MPFFKNTFYFAAALILSLGLFIFSCDEENDEKTKLPVIESHPASVTWNVFTVDSIKLSVTADSSDDLSYQWYKNDVNSFTDSEIIANKSASLTLEKEEFPTNGNYYFYVIVKNSKGSVTSNIACVNVLGNLDYGYTVKPLPEAIKKEWVTMENKFTITENAVTINWGASAQSGTIESHRSNAAGSSGLITIKHTVNNAHPNHNGSYYVIYYEDIRFSSVKIAGALKDNYPEFAAGGNGGKTTIAEAEAIYTISGGFFEDISLYGKKSEGDPINHNLYGVWKDAQETTSITITNSTITFEVDMTLILNWIETVFEGELVDYADNGNSGYLVFKYTQISETFRDMHAMFGIDLTGTYSVLVWRNYNETASSVSIGMDWFLEDCFTYGLMLTKEDAIAGFGNGEYYSSMGMIIDLHKK